MQTYSVFRCAFFKPSSSARLVYELSSAPSSTPPPTETTEARKVTDIDNQKRFSPTEAANAARNSSDAASREMQAACSGALCGMDKFAGPLEDTPEEIRVRIAEFRALGEKVKDVLGDGDANDALRQAIGIDWDSGVSAEGNGREGQVGHNKFATKDAYQSFLNTLGKSIDDALINVGESWEDVVGTNVDFKAAFGSYIQKEKIRNTEGISSLLKEDGLEQSVKNNIEMALNFGAQLALLEGSNEGQASRVSTALNAFGNEGAKNFANASFKETMSQLVTLASSGMGRDIDFNDPMDSDADLARAAMEKVPGLSMMLGVNTLNVAKK